MHPILFEIGGFSVHTYGALGALGFLILAGLSLWRGKKAGHSLERITDLIFWTAILSILGSRLLYVWQNPENIETWFDVINIRGGGLVFYGALLTGIPVGSLLMKRFGMPFFEMWDIFATGFPIAHGIARLGCFCAGCCYGTYAGDLSWGVVFPDSPLVAAPENTPLHPVQLYEAGGLFLIGIIVNVFYAKKTFDGQVIALYLLLYAALRATTEMFRGDIARGYFLESVLGQTLSYSQGVSIGVALVAIAVFLAARQRAATETSSAKE